MADDASNLAKANAAPAAPKGDPSTHFLFAHKLFEVNGAYFGISSQTDEPVFNVTLGELKAALTLPTLAQEFGLEADSGDGKLLSIVAKSLRFVKEIRPGDSIPRELLDGTCSWTLEPHHHAVARARLTVNLTAWISGEEAPTSDPELLRNLADDAETKQRLNDALGEVAEKLGYGRERKGKVLDQIEEVARELAYIEALRDRFGKIKMIDRKIADAAKLYRRERALSEEIQRIQVLLRPPIGELESIFDKVDMQTSEVLHVLRKIRQQIEFIRAQRDDLHTRLMRWDEMIVLWDPIPGERCDAIENALRTTYRFLARYFPQRSDWTLTHNKR